MTALAIPQTKYLIPEQRVLNPYDRSIEPEVGDKGWGGLSMQIKDIDSKRHAIEAVLSSDADDRYGEVVDPKGFEPFLERFMENPQGLYCHDHTINVGHWEKMRITKHTFEGWIVFDDRDRFAMKIWRKYERKIMRAFSVGFISHEWIMEDVDAVKGKARRRRRFTVQEPLEGSACTVPANHEALSKTLSAMLGSRAANVQKKSDIDDSSIDARVERAVERKIKQLFHTGPGGLMTTLAQDIAELVVCGGPGEEDGYGDIHEPDVPDPVSASDGQDHELKAALLDALGKSE